MLSHMGYFSSVTAAIFNEIQGEQRTRLRPSLATAMWNILFFTFLIVKQMKDQILISFLAGNQHRSMGLHLCHTAPQGRMQQLPSQAGRDITVQSAYS